jgi:hypothetical protein
MVSPPFEHAGDARAALREIVAEHGPKALSDPPALSNLLKDLLPDAPRVARLLVAAAEERVSVLLRDHVDQGLDAATATRLALSSLASSTMYNLDACTWVVNEVAVALGLIAETAADTMKIAGDDRIADTSGDALSVGMDLPLEPPPTITPGPPAEVGTARTTTQAAITMPVSAAAARSGRKPRRWLVPFVAVVVVLSTAGGALAAWALRTSPPTPPVPRPIGLAAGTTTANSTMLTWSYPATSPRPAHYVIFQDGVAVGSVPGTITSYQATSLAPGTSYAYQVMAFRGGHHSPRSSAVTISTLTPPIAAAILAGPWTVTYHHVTWYGYNASPLPLLADSWTFAPECAVGPCSVRLTGAFENNPFTTTLHRHGAVYTGTATNTYPSCLSAPVENHMKFQIKVLGAGADGSMWTATSWVGTMILYTSGNCSTAGITADIHGNP